MLIGRPIAWASEKVGSLVEMPDVPLKRGLEAIASPGHTPGHTCFRRSGAREDILFWGDVVHVPELQVPRPDITIAFDVDQQLAAQSRLKILDMCASDGVLVAGSHMHFPGFSFIDRGVQGFRFTNEPWISEL
jgi:glyoxylase-like metal-dependent hydrolase (beta-lactamase superfamily II)